MNFYSKVKQFIDSVPADDMFYTNDHIQQSKRIAIFGSGSFGQDMARNLIYANRKVDYFIDNDDSKHGSIILGIEVISLDQLLSKQYNHDPLLIVICSTWHKQIQQQLLNANVSNFIVADNIRMSKLAYKSSDKREMFEQFFNSNKEKFDEVYNIFEDSPSKELYLKLIAYRVSGNINCLKVSEFKQYQHPEVMPEIGDVIIDGGGYIGDTAIQFNEIVNENCTIHSFEPSKDNFNQMEKWIESKQVNNVMANQAGLGKEKQELYINSTEGFTNPANMIVDQGNEKVVITSIDNYVEERSLKDVNLIKLDVEGYELPALQGAHKTIQTFGSKLQVCLYHKNEDLIDIPLYLYHNYKASNYKFYLGHHRENYTETVLYAKKKM